MSFGVFGVINRISMKNSFVVGVFNSCVGFFVLLSGVAYGAGGGFLLRCAIEGCFLSPTVGAAIGILAS